MGSKHPLDVFRSSEDGFARATRQRRTVTGKVILSTVRKSAPQTVPLSAGRPRPKRSLWPFGDRPTSAKARRAEGSSRTLFYGAVAVLAAVALAVVLRQTFHGSLPGDLPTLRLEETLTRKPPPPGVAEAPAPAAFTIKAASYNGSQQGLQQALAAQTELVRRLFEEVTVVGYPLTDKPEVFTNYVVLVGKVPRAEALGSVLERLRAITDWAGGKAAPFVSAVVVPWPEPAPNDP